MSQYKGTVVNPAEPDLLEVKRDCTLVVKDGIVESIVSGGEAAPEIPEEHDTVDFGDGILIPAFSDLHIHLSQYAQRGLGMDCLMFDWLNKYTFPQEADFRDLNYAKVMYAQAIRDLLLHGTMHVNVFSTIHYEASDLLFKMLEASGMYAYSSKINIDMNAPDFYTEKTEQSLEDTERFICEHIQGYSGRVKPILIPRFAPTCSEPLLKGLGKLAQKYGLGLHTHLVESKEEAAWAKELHPQCLSDGDIYEQYGLLSGEGPKIFAHVIFPTEVEKNVLKKYNAVSVHCPDSTTNITAGIMPSAVMSEEGYRIALGTDVGGGHFMGLYRQVSRAIQLSKLKEYYENDAKRLLFANAFYMATAEGGSVFGNAGKIEPGYRLDALVIGDVGDNGHEISELESVERFCYAGDDRNIKARILSGKMIDVDDIFSRIMQI